MTDLLIVGGGFAGVWAALGAASARAQHSRVVSGVRVTLVSRDPWFTVRPRLYEPSVDNARVPLDSVLRPAGVSRVEGLVTGIDTSARSVAVDGPAGRRALRYDRLVVAAGSHVHRVELPGDGHVFSVDTYDEAMKLHAHLAALAGREPSGDDSRFTAVVVGGGFTGIETATALVARLRTVAARAAPGARARVVVVESAAHVAPGLSGAARSEVERALRSLGIEWRVGSRVTAIHPDRVTLDSDEWIATGTTVWTGGFRANRLAAQLGVELDPIGRVPVDELLRVRGLDGVYAAGDVARAMADDVHVAPMSCQYAIPMGERAGTNALLDLLGIAGTPYSQPDYVTCLDLGEAGALFMQGWEHDVRLTGFWAKLTKETINTRLIYPPVRDMGFASRGSSETQPGQRPARDRDLRPGAGDGA